MLRRTKAVLSVLVALTIVSALTGCTLAPGDAQSGKSSAHAASVQGEEHASLTQADDIQSLKEIQMVFLFRILIQMDKKPAISLSKAQAEEMLPVVKRSVSDGSMNGADHKAIVDLLSKEQQSFYSDAMEHMKKVLENIENQVSEGKEELTDEERNKLADDLEASRRRKSQHHEAVKSGGNTDTDHPGNPEDDDWLPKEKNVEQQLIELLESKIRN